MTRSQFCFTSLGVLASLTSILTRPSAAADPSTTRSFDVQDGGRLQLETDLGSVTVRTGSTARVEVEVSVSGSNVDAFEVEFAHAGADVTVTGVLDRPAGGSRSWREPRVAFEVTVPKRYDLDLQTAGGAIELGDLDGVVAAKTSGGAIELGQITGNVEAKTSGGGITLAGTRGDARLQTSGGSIHGGEIDGRLDAETSGGSIRITKVSGIAKVESSGGSIEIEAAHAAVDAETSGGGIKIGFASQPKDDSRLVTSGGDVKVALAEGLGFELDVRASHVSCDLPLSTEQATQGRLTGRIGAGGPKLSLRTTGGNAKIRRR